MTIIEKKSLRKKKAILSLVEKGEYSVGYALMLVEDLSKYMNYFVKPNFKEVGKVFGSNIKEFASKLENITTDDILKLENGESITMDIAGTSYDINKDMVDVRISSKEGFNVGSENNNFVILNTTLTEDLILEGLARECISKVQQLRKNSDFNIVDRINL